MESTTMMSLYEYLGRAAGPELGKKVAEAAGKARVKIDSHYVENSRYKGDILKYPKEFLDSYFRPQTAIDDELPF
jgi:hypothetical protein